jgi:hypothetical protein
LATLSTMPMACSPPRCASRCGLRGGTACPDAAHLWCPPPTPPCCVPAPQVCSAWRKGRVDAVVQSTDKNFMVPVGGAVLAARRGATQLVSAAWSAAGSPLFRGFCSHLFSQLASHNLATYASGAVRWAHSCASCLAGAG